MKVYSLTSTRFQGEILFTFNDNELLCGLQIEAELSESQHIFLLKKIPREIVELDNFKKLKDSSVTITEVSQDITFDMFWNKYDEKIRSSKKRAEQKWNKMPKGEQNKAYAYIPKYNRSLTTGISKKYAESYLNAELWNN